MAKTMKFRTSVTTPTKTYVAGTDVPIGKDGIDAEEAKRIEDAFGPWTPETAADNETIIASLQGELDRVGAERNDALVAIATLQKSVAPLEARSAKLASEKAALEASNAALASDKAALETSLSEARQEIDTVSGDVSTLAKEVESLTAEKNSLTEQVKQLAADLEAAKAKK